MNGSLDAESVVGEGSRFRVTLPLPRATTEQIAEAALPADPASSSVPAPERSLEGTRVLVAEDNPFNQKVAQYILEKLGVRVTWPATAPKRCRW